MVYEFKHKDLRFSHGGFDELLALDRYAVPANNPDDINVGDTVVIIVDKRKDIRKVGIIQSKNDETFTVQARDGDIHTVDVELVAKPLEHTPQEFWTRWSLAAARVEKPDKVDEIHNRFREMFDGYKYSPGGRIQLSVGQEYVTGKRAALTAYNCFVLPSPKGSSDPAQQFKYVLESVLEQIHIMRRGGGVGFNLSYIQTVKGATNPRIVLVLGKKHKDADELKEKLSIGKFQHVKVATKRPEGIEPFIVDDSVEGIMDAAIYMVEQVYNGSPCVLDFTKLRHRRAFVKGVNGRSSGAVSWMELFDVIAELLSQDEVDVVDFAEIPSTTTNLIEQGGSRRGALMLILEDYRRDVLRKFITRKRTSGKLTGANISVGISDGFMDAVNCGSEEECALFDEIAQSAWASAEPGVVFLERCNKESNSWYFNPLVATNPLAKVAVGM